MRGGGERIKTCLEKGLEKRQEVEEGLARQGENDRGVEGVQTERTKCAQRRGGERLSPQETTPPQGD